MNMKQVYIDGVKDTKRELEYCKEQWKKHDDQELYWFTQMTYYQGRLEVLEETLEWLD